MCDVAALAGVSFKTVSRVVNHEPGVSPALTARVSAAATALDYRHNVTASNLRRGQRTMSVGVLIQDVSNGFSAVVLRAIEDRARERGIAVFAASLDEEEQRERDTVAALIGRRVDGLILMPASFDQSYLQGDVRAGLAVVVVDRPPHHLDVDAVLVDNVGGSCAAVEHLVRRGHRRIAFVSDRSSIATAADRRQGYLLALRRAGIEPQPALLRQQAHSRQQAAAAVRELLALRDPPTALFAARNDVAIGAIRALRELGLEHDIALVGFDDFSMADLVDPPTTVVSQDPAAVGRAAAGLLIARLDGDTSPHRRVVLPTALIARGSGEIPPLTDARSRAGGMPA